GGYAALAACKQASQHDNEYRTGDLGGNLHGAAGLAKALHDHNVGNQHSAGNPAQQRGTEGDDHREAVDKLENDGAAPDDDRYTDDQTEDDQAQLMVRVRALRRACNGDHVIQAHDVVGDDDGLDSGPNRRAALNIAVRELMWN